WVTPRRVMQGHPARVHATLRNFGGEARQAMTVELRAGGAFRARQSVALLAGQEITIHFDTRFEEAGSQHVEVWIASDAVNEDNRHAAGVEVAPALSVLVLRDPDYQ